MFPTSSTRDRGIYFFESRPTENRREFKNCRAKTSLEHIDGTTLDLVVFDIKGSEVMTMRQREDEQSKEITQTHR